MEPAPELAVLVGVELRDRPGLFGLDDSLAELERLAAAAGVTVVGVIEQRLDRPNPATLIGSGKVAELVALRVDTGANLVIFDEELSPAQQREIERAIGNPNVKILDRTALILDVFARHAHTREGALQVELAQYEYRLPRLTRAWTHLARQAGGAAGRGGTGGVGLRGPGETQLEVDRREIGRRIAHIKRELEDVRAHRAQYRRRRFDEGVPVVALVGYTNAGKSTLLNALSGSEVFAADQLFATLDPTTRRVVLPGGRHVLFTDTVGFIQKLPTTLVAAFRATLEEIAEADILLHVVDITHENAQQQADSVLQVLEELQATGRPIITALNKIDRLPEYDRAADILAGTPDRVAISAINGWGLDELLARIEALLTEGMLEVAVMLPFERGDLVSLAHERGMILREQHSDRGTHLVARLPKSIVLRFLDYVEDSGQ